MDPAANRLLGLGYVAVLALLALVVSGVWILVSRLDTPEYPSGYTARLVIDNTTDFELAVRVRGRDEAEYCTAQSTAGAGTSTALEFMVPSATDSIGCGDEPTTVIFTTGARTWSCAWFDAKDHEPVAFTTNGPECEFLESMSTPTADKRSPAAAP